MVMAVVTAHILSPSSELENLLPVKILVLSLLLNQRSSSLDNFKQLCYG